MSKEDEHEDKTDHDKETEKEDEKGKKDEGVNEEVNSARRRSSKKIHEASMGEGGRPGAVRVGPGGAHATNKEGKDFDYNSEDFRHSIKDVETNVLREEFPEEGSKELSEAFKSGSEHLTPPSPHVSTAFGDGTLLSDGFGMSPHASIDASGNGTTSAALTQEGGVGEAGGFVEEGSEAFVQTASVTAETHLATVDEDGEQRFEGELVKEPDYVEAKVLNVNRIRKVTIIIAVVVIVAAVAIGVGLGVFVDNSEPPPEDVLRNITANETTPLQETDFDEYTVNASRCFNSTQELYEVVDSYVRLRGIVTGAEDGEDYLSIRNESLDARDEIAMVYGWPIGEFCVSEITNMDNLFSPEREDSSKLELLAFDEDISNWDVSNVGSMYNMFWECKQFNQPLNSWNVSSVTDMSYMFEAALAFNQDISAWDVSSVEDMTAMFFNAISFNQPVGSWKTSSLLYVFSLFDSASAFNQDLAGWDVSRVYEFNYMFSSAKSFNQDLSKWEISQAFSFFDMFTGALDFNQPSTCEWGFQLQFGDLSNAFTNTSCEVTEDPNIYDWPLTSFCGDCPTYFEDILSQNVLDGEEVPSTVAFQTYAELLEAADDFMVYRLGKNEDAGAIRTKLAKNYGWPIGNWDVSLIEDFSRIFSGWRSKPMWLFNDDISSWNVERGVMFAGTFNGVAFFNYPLNGWDVSNANDTSSMLSSAIAFNQDISNWNVAKVRDFGGMFSDATVFNQDLSSWVTSSATSITGMFRGTKAFDYDLPWDVSRVVDFGDAFRDSRFNGDIRGWNTGGGEIFTSMFSNDPKFNQDISGWDMRSALDTQFMFQGSAFNTDISSWQLSSATALNFMFAQSPFDHNLCAWGPYLARAGVFGTLMFQTTPCPEEFAILDITADPVGPLCYACT